MFDCILRDWNLLRFYTLLTKAYPSEGGDAKSPAHESFMGGGAARIQEMFHAILAPCQVDILIDRPDRLCVQPLMIIERIADGWTAGN